MIAPCNDFPLTAHGGDAMIPPPRQGIASCRRRPFLCFRTNGITSNRFSYVWSDRAASFWLLSFQPICAHFRLAAEWSRAPEERGGQVDGSTQSYSRRGMFRRDSGDDSLYLWLPQHAERCPARQALFDHGRHAPDRLQLRSARIPVWAAACIPTEWRAARRRRVGIRRWRVQAEHPSMAHLASIPTLTVHRPRARTVVRARTRGRTTEPEAVLNVGQSRAPKAGSTLALRDRFGRDDSSLA